MKKLSELSFEELEVIGKDAVRDARKNDRRKINMARLEASYREAAISFGKWITKYTFTLVQIFIPVALLIQLAFENRALSKLNKNRAKDKLSTEK